MDYYEKIEKLITLYRLSNNYGYSVFLLRKDIFSRYEKGYYVITDPDVLPDENCPAHFLERFKTLLDNNNEVNKVGFSLRIDDIPDSNPAKSRILRWEKRFWINRTPEGNYRGAIDTTFALYRP